jgi:peptidoglycan/xylan/chitin deacetylase (PgdA/CDA1 family)
LKLNAFRDLLGLSYYPLRIKNKLSTAYHRQPHPRLRVLSYHDISLADETLFSRQLKWVRQTWDFVTPQVFAAMIDGNLPIKRDSLLLTFDDGTVSNMQVAERVLKPLGIYALFFIVTKYALLSELDDWRSFASLNIFLKRNPLSIPENFRNMSIANLKTLVSAGHTIGAHTASHSRLSTLTGKELHEEIVGGADLLESHLQMPVQHFAYPFGDFTSINVEANCVARKRFGYVYTGMRGDNGVYKQAWQIQRDSNDPIDSLLYTGACLEGGADFLYAKKNKICRERMEFETSNPTHISLRIQ